MPKELTDTREPKIQTIEEAKTVFNAIAISEIAIAKADAAMELRIANLKEQHAAKVAMIDPQLDMKRKELAEYIAANKDKFRKPRNIKTDFGSFGLQKANKVKITDKKACLDFVVKNKMADCFKVKASIVKSGIMTALEAGKEILGAKLLKGDIAHYTVSKALIDEAKKCS